MVMRITNQIQQSNALQNIFKITEDLFAANQRVATGKRINKPSDDPLGIQDTLDTSEFDCADSTIWQEYR